MRMWDIRPFAASAAQGQQQQQSRCERVFEGSTSGPEKGLLRCGWVGHEGKERVVCGSADRHVRIWDTMSGKVLYLLPGHKGSVNDVSLICSNFRKFHSLNFGY